MRVDMLPGKTKFSQIILKKLMLKFYRKSAYFDQKKKKKMFKEFIGKKY